MLMPNENIAGIRTRIEFQIQVEKTELFLAIVKQHKPISYSTLARWLKSVLEKAGIDTTIFKAHSVMGAAT